MIFTPILFLQDLTACRLESDWLCYSFSCFLFPPSLSLLSSSSPGNGPAAIFLSLILSGYWPYFSGSHPDEYLTARLKEGEGKSLLEQVSGQ